MESYCTSMASYCTSIFNILVNCILIFTETKPTAIPTSSVGGSLCLHTSACTHGCWPSWEGLFFQEWDGSLLSLWFDFLDKEEWEFSKCAFKKCTNQLCTSSLIFSVIPGSIWKIFLTLCSGLLLAVFWGPYSSGDGQYWLHEDKCLQPCLNHFSGLVHLVC